MTEDILCQQGCSFRSFRIEVHIHSDSESRTEPPADPGDPGGTVRILLADASPTK